MDRLSYVTIIFLLIVHQKIHSQEIVDYAHSRISYEFSYKTNPVQSEYAKTDLMYLDIGEKKSQNTIAGMNKSGTPSMMKGYGKDCLFLK